MKVNVAPHHRKSTKKHTKRMQNFFCAPNALRMAVLVLVRGNRREDSLRLNFHVLDASEFGDFLGFFFSQHNKNPFWRKGMSLGESRRRFIAFAFFLRLVLNFYLRCNKNKICKALARADGCLL